MNAVLPAAGIDFADEAEVLIIGAGACGLTAALSARDAGSEVLALERDASPSGSTALSSGFIPAPGTRAQAVVGIDDDAARFAADIQAKSKGKAVAELVDLAAQEIGPALDWLQEAHGLEWTVIQDFLYPGHSRHRMHAVPEKTGAALMARLLNAAEAAGVSIAADAPVDTLFANDDGRIRGVEVARPDGGKEHIGCRRLVLACNGYGGNPALVAEHIPSMTQARYFGHASNQGDAILWGGELGAGLRHLAGFQGHGSVAHPHGVLITWALMMEGALQINARGERFSNETDGYSEQASRVAAQPGAIAWNVYDEARHRFALGFPDYQEAVGAGAIREAENVSALAGVTGVDADILADALERQTPDPFGRDFSGVAPLEPPYRAVRVTGALFHTQGGLMIDAHARVLREDGSAFPNLFAGGGAACGVSGPADSGYLSGNGLLTAVAFGRLAGTGMPA